MACESKSKFMRKSVAKVFMDAELADVNFVFKLDKGNQLPAHKIILASGSSVFRAMLFGGWKEKDVVEIVDSSLDGFKEFLQFFYLDNVQLTMENLEEVVQLADKYDILDCLNNYAASLIGKLAVDNICLGYQLAVMTDHGSLKKYCERYICAFPVDVFQSIAFLSINSTVLKHILEFETLNCDETDIFKACLSWAKVKCKETGMDENNPNDLKHLLGDCFYLIRFCAMQQEQFAEYTAEYKGLFTRDELVHILDKKKFNPNPRIKSVVFYHKQKLICEQEGNNTTWNRYNIKSPESLWFSTNSPILLSEIICVRLFEGGAFTSALYTISILEKNSQSLENLSPTKKIFESFGNFSNKLENKILVNSLAIRPKHMYEIRIELAWNRDQYYCTSGQWNAENKLNDDVTVKIHQTNSFVSILCFNQPT